MFQSGAFEGSFFFNRMSDITFTLTCLIYSIYLTYFIAACSGQGEHTRESKETPAINDGSINQSVNQSFVEKILLEQN